MKKTIITLCCYLASIAHLLTGSVQAKSLPLHKLNMPKGFSISIFAELDNPRQMTRSESGIIYVGSRGAGKVYAVIDSDADYRADRVITLDKNLNLPSGLAMKGKDLYVGAVDKILVYRNIDSQPDAPTEPETLIDTLPDKRHHGWKYLEFGPDGLLYIPVGAPCNICLSAPPFASILRTDITLQQPVLETFASGVRNSVGFDWHPVTGDFWFTDNGRDMMGDELPPCELNRAPESGLHFGYPYFHGNGIKDPEFGKDKIANNYTGPALSLDPHVAPLGMTFYTGQQFPGRFRNQILIPEHGSWNRSKEAGHTGHRLMLVTINENGTIDRDKNYEIFVDGWLQNNKAWGRPADILELPDGSILVSDDKADVIYRISYHN